MELFNKEIKYGLNGKSLSAYHRCLQTLHQISIWQIVIFDTCYMKQFMQVVAQAHQPTRLGAQINQRFIEAVWLWEYPLFLVLCLNK